MLPSLVCGFVWTGRRSQFPIEKAELSDGKEKVKESLTDQLVERNVQQSGKGAERLSADEFADRQNQLTVSNAYRNGHFGVLSLSTLCDVSLARAEGARAQRQLNGEAGPRRGAEQNSRQTQRPRAAESAYIVASGAVQLRNILTVVEHGCCFSIHNSSLSHCAVLPRRSLIAGVRNHLNQLAVTAVIVV